MTHLGACISQRAVLVLADVGAQDCRVLDDAQGAAPAVLSWVYERAGLPGGVQRREHGLEAPGCIGACSGCRSLRFKGKACLLACILACFARIMVHYGA